jgi:hypothetical protein
MSIETKLRGELISQLMCDKDELLQALKDLLAVECIDDYSLAHEKAKDAIAKFERVL